MKNDAEQFFGFNRAAILYLYSGNAARSRKAMEKAASVAEATGDVLTAANAWVDAAFISIVEGYAGKRRECVARARSLAESEQLTGADRDAILARIDGAPTSASAARLASPGALLVSD